TVRALNLPADQEVRQYSTGERQSSNSTPNIIRERQLMFWLGRVGPSSPQQRPKPFGYSVKEALPISSKNGVTDQ
ncbi:hypothetical protein KI387_001007, partial [Taxus chinensis]